MGSQNLGRNSQAFEFDSRQSQGLPGLLFKFEG
jgi:hypothetical protein